MPDATTGAPADMHWTATVTVPLPDCPSVEAAWEKLATQTTWSEWRTASKLRGKDIVTTLVPPATEPLKMGDEYVVRVARFMTIHCRVLESSSGGSSAAEGGASVFDATGVAIGGIVKVRFRFTVFRGEDGIVMARAQERFMAVRLLAPSRETLENEHRHTFKDLNRSFLSPVSAGASGAHSQI